MIDYENELPTAVVTVKHARRAIKLDTGALYTPDVHNSVAMHRAATATLGTVLGRQLVHLYLAWASKCTPA